MAKTYSIRLSASELTIGDDPVHGNSTGGKELMDRLREEVYPTTTGRASRVVGGKVGRSAESVEFFETISGASKGSTEYKTARRNFQRYAGGRNLTPRSLPTVEGYQARYEMKNGERSPILDVLIEAAGGKVPENPEEDISLPPGKMTITMKSKVSVITGKKKKGGTHDTRSARPVPIDIGRGRQDEALHDPLAEWARGFEDYVATFSVSDVQWVQVDYIPTKE